MRYYHAHNHLVLSYIELYYFLIVLNSVACPSGCSACTSPTECTDCLDGYNLEDQLCVGKNTILLQYDSAKYTNNVTDYQKLIYCFYIF